MSTEILSGLVGEDAKLEISLFGQQIMQSSYDIAGKMPHDLLGNGTIVLDAIASYGEFLTVCITCRTLIFLPHDH